MSIFLQSKAKKYYDRSSNHKYTGGEYTGGNSYRRGTHLDRVNDHTHVVVCFTSHTAHKRLSSKEMTAGISNIINTNDCDYTTNRQPTIYGVTMSGGGGGEYRPARVLFFRVRF